MSQKTSQQMEITPIDDLILKGVKERLTEVFQVPVVFSNSSDVVQALKKVNPEMGAAPYPYMRAKLSTLDTSKTSYKPHTLMRRGRNIVLTNDNKMAYTATILPSDMTFEVEYTDNNFPRLVKFAKSWMFASVGGWLKFTVQYGEAIDIHVALETNVAIPSREADPGNTTAYVATTTFLVAGYISRAKLRDQQAATIVDTTGYLQELGAVGKNTQIFSFKKSSSL